MAKRGVSKKNQRREPVHVRWSINKMWNSQEKLNDVEATTMREPSLGTYHSLGDTRNETYDTKEGKPLANACGGGWEEGLLLKSAFRGQIAFVQEGKVSRWKGVSVKKHRSLVGASLAGGTWEVNRGCTAKNQSVWLVSRTSVLDKDLFFLESLGEGTLKEIPHFTLQDYA